MIVDVIRGLAHAALYLALTAIGALWLWGGA